MWGRAQTEHTSDTLQQWQHIHSTAKTWSLHCEIRALREPVIHHSDQPALPNILGVSSQSSCMHKRNTLQALKSRLQAHPKSAYRPAEPVNTHTVPGTSVHITGAQQLTPKSAQHPNPTPLNPQTLQAPTCMPTPASIVLCCPLLGSSPAYLCFKRKDVSSSQHCVHPSACSEEGSGSHWAAWRQQVEL
jgi:hypothetical protein